MLSPSALIRLVALLSPMRSILAKVGWVRSYRSATCWMQPSSTSASTSLSPKPSISMALRLTKCFMACFTCAPQLRPLGQRKAASPCSLSNSPSHTGHCIGATNAWAPSIRFANTACTTFGITSPARRTITVSPSCRSRREISSILCKVALLTVTPPTKTGSKRATGVTAPVRPT